MKKSVEAPARPVQEKKPTGPSPRKPGTEKSKPYSEPGEKEKRIKPTETRSPEMEGDEYEGTVHSEGKDGEHSEHTPDGKPW